MAKLWNSPFSAQLIQQAVVEAAPDEGAVELFDVDTGDDRVVSFVDHLAREERGRATPKGEQRSDARAEQLGLAVLPHFS
jgi:hypothetical protein